jgi:hypothetical protein
MATWAAAQLATSTLAEYDDEGYVMMSLQSYLSGRPLYTETYTQYGPAYYQLQGLIHHLTHWPVNHDVTRAKTVVVWITAAALAGLIVYRVSRHRWLAWIGFLAMACHLDKLCLEPGHPQEVCLLGTLVALLAATWLDFRRPRQSWMAAIGMGIATGIVIMTKINVGGLLVVGLGTSLLLCLPAHRGNRWILTAAVTAALLIPTMVCRQCWNPQWWNISLPMIVSLGTAGVCWWSENRVAQAGAWKYLLAFVATTGATCTASVLVCLAQGTTWTDLGYGLIGQHAGFDRSFYHSAPVYWPAVLLGLGLIGLLPRVRAGSEGTVAAWVALFVTAGVTWGFALATGHAARSGLEVRGCSAWLLSFGPLLAWAAIPMRPTRGTSAEDGDRPTAEPQPENFVGGVCVAIVGCLLPLMAYPTPGTQVELGTVGLLLVSLIVVGHHWPACELAKPREPRPSDPTLSRAGVQPVFVLLAALLLITADRDVRWTMRRESYRAVNLPGAQWLRLPAKQAQQQQALVAAIERRHVSTFVFAEHGQNRFYFWTGMAPPTGFNATFWPYMLTDRQQGEVIRQLEQRPASCVIAMDGGDALVPQDRLVPLRTYLQRAYQPSERIGPWVIWDRTPTVRPTRPVVEPTSTSP